ncbi:nSTAND1 domain-containing NTPase [Lentzea cavernae]|uniref:WD40 repeat n=1 Tax=Lentzea cavernae TaxID=2020703 RepID=A0ABQ3MPZ8_9PSEU|nr:hypothetical protein [Lentzea cavernae]GHH52305.1 hypothetical protein GCM10017774_64150 [Lentzea cavernae]
MGRIFLSYHGHDEGDVIALYLRDALLAAGFEDVHAYTAPGSGPDVSLPWKDSLRRELLGADALIVVSSPGSFSEWCIWESSVFRERKPHSPCIEFFSARSQNRAILNDLQAQRVDATSPASLAAARDTMLEVLERAGVSKAAPLSSPFPGLKAFDEHQASLFFGREEDVQRLAEPLLGRRSHGAMAVIGPSGAGKSSLVRAGLIPLLRREGWTIIGPVTPSQGVLPPIEGPGRRLVVLDQAEELLMTESSDLIQQLVDASRGGAWVVYTVRADFLDELMRREDFAPLLRDDFLVTPLTKAELPVVVNGPLRSFGWSVDDAALGLIQEDASRESLPLLAFALENLWRHVNPDGKRAPRPITRAEYIASGRVMDVLQLQADEALAMARDLVRNDDGSWPSVREAEHQVLQTLRRLVAVDESGKYTRCSVAASDLSAESRRLLDPFITNRVLTATRETVEVAHESLFLHWPRLREELERDRSTLRARREVEDSAAKSEDHPDQLIVPSRLNLLLEMLVPPLEDAPFASSWARLENAMIALRLTDRARRLLAKSLQHKADEEARRSRLLSPADALNEMVSDDLALRLLGAPDLTNWRQSLLWAMSSTHLLRSITGPGAGIQGVDWSHDDTRLVTGSDDGVVRVWDAVSGECLQAFQHGDGSSGVQAVAWSPADEIIASVAADGALRLWSLRENREVRSAQVPARPLVVRFDAEGGRVLVASATGGIVVLDVRGDDVQPISGHQPSDKTGNPVLLCDADISSDGRWTAAARADGRVDISLTAGDPAQRPEKRVPTQSPLRSFRFHPVDAEIFASGDSDFDAHLHHSDRTRALMGHTGEVRGVAWSPEGTRLATASEDGTTRIWDAVTGDEVLRLSGHPRGVRDMAWSRRGDRLSTVSDDGLHRVWKVGSDPDYRWFGTREPVRALAWNSAEHELTVGRAARSDDTRTPAHWTLEVSRRDVKFVDAPEPTALAWTPDGRVLATGTARGAVLLGTGHRELTRSTDDADGVADLSWSCDGSLLAVASQDRKRSLPRIFDAAGNRVTPGSWRRHSGFLNAVSWHPHEQIVAIADDDNTITVNSLDRTLCHLRINKRFTSLAWHPDGKLLAAGCTDATVCLLHLSDELEERSQLSGHRGQINAVAWSPNGKNLLTASDDRTARVWDPETGGQRTALIGHSMAVTAALWSSDGLAVTGSADRTVRFWDTTDGDTHPLSGTAMSGDLADLIREARLRIS